MSNSSPFVCSLTFVLKMFLYMLDVKIEAADNRAESVDDITAAAMAPIPMMEM